MRSPPAVRRVAVADELTVLLLRGACPLAGALQQLQEGGGSDAGQVGSGERCARKTGSPGRLTRRSPAARKTRTGQDDGFRTALLTRPRMGAFSYFLKASLIFAPAILVSPLTWSPRPSAFRRELPVARPAVFLKLPFTASALCAIFLAILTGGTFRGVILLARTRQPGHRDPASRR